MSSPGAALLERLGLVPTPQFCTAHGSAPYLPLVCTTCISGKRLCASCIIEHSVEHPTHALLPPPALDVTSLRARITQAPQAVVEGCFAVSNNAAAVGGGPAGGAAASYDAPSTTPLVACARHKVAAFAAELELLEERAEAALARIQEDRETAHALVEATFKVRADELEMAVASKRSALQAELVVAQGSLDQATHATEVLIEAALTLADADTAAHAAALLALENSARASVAAIPVVPSTSSYISVSDRPAPQTLLASVEDVFGSVCLEPRDPDIHVHTPHCTHAGFVASPNAFLAAFTAHPGNARSFVSLGLSEGDSASLIGSAALKQLHDEILRRFSNQLKSMVVPISCLLPSQLIALSLMSRLAGTQDVLMRLGEGQGKSIVLALAAAAALKAARSPQRVIVFTSSDHLALRDHAFASKFFAAEALESIAITHDSSSLVGFQTARVIYANALAVDRLLSDLIMDFNEGEFLGPDQAAFVNVFFSIEESSYAVILDEFDLLLDDLVKQLPKVKRIPTYILSRADAEHPSQDIIPELRTDEHDSLRWICADEAEAFVDPLTGVTCSKVYTMMYSEGNERAGWFHLAPSVFRLSQFLERAESVKGLSGSTNDDSTYVLGRRNWGSTIPFFALPSWHDPTVFDTEIIPSGFESEIAIKSGSVGNDVRNRSVWCQTRRVINRPEDRIIPMDPTTGLPFIGKVFLEDISLPTLAEVDIWAQQIVSDIIVTSHRGPKRPVLVFAPSANKLFRSGPPVVAGRSPPTKSILSHLVTKINESFSGDIVFVAPTDRDLTDAEIQQIGHAGVITVASLVLGRGIDIRPSSDIPGGLHVIVATEVAHKRLLKQTICRTGRFGRPGSFSIITLHRILSARSDLDTRDYDQWWMAALHHLTALGVAHLASKRESLPPSDRKQWVQRWLLFLLGCMQRGKEETARVREALSVAPDSDATPAWCIPDDDFAKLLVLVPRGPEIETFYARLETLEGAGPRSVDPKIDE